MKKIFLVLLAFPIIVSCKKNHNDEDHLPDAQLNKQILNDFAGYVSKPTYDDLSNKTIQLAAAVQQFNANANDSNLTICRNLWKSSRSAWEQSEGFLFGPVSTENIDPRIDTWPVNYVDLDSILASTHVLDAAYINSLEDALKGFHPIEYLLFGNNGQKPATQFTPREHEYLLALCDNLKQLTQELSNAWNPSTSGNYYTIFTTAGEGSSIYSTQRSAFEELVIAMGGICDEVANGKMAEPFTQQNPALEESPFSGNSLTDFINNIHSVQNVYLGKYSANGMGLEDLVRKHNLSLDAEIKSRINTAIGSLNAISLPFGEAIIQQPVQVQNAIDAINNLGELINTDLMLFVQQHTQ